MKIKLKNLLLSLGVLSILAASAVIFINGAKADASNPFISNILVSNLSDTQATIAWSSTNTDVSLIRYGTVDTTVGRNLTASDNTAMTSHQLNLTGLTPNTTYFFRIVSNSQTTPVESLSYSLVTLATNSTFISNVVVSNITDTQATVSWNSTSSDISLIRYGTVDTTVGRNLTASDNTAMTSHQLNLTGLTPNTTYFFRIVSNSQTTPVESSSFSFMTLIANTNPLISNVSISSITDTQAIISWMSNNSDISLIRYGTTDTTGGRNLIASDSTMTTSHQLNLTGLTPNTTYFFRIVSNSNSLDNSLESSSFSFLTLTTNGQNNNPGEHHDHESMNGNRTGEGNNGNGLGNGRFFFRRNGFDHSHRFNHSNNGQSNNRGNGRGDH